ncbi:NAD(P)-dependent dehydrogenase (short-subunit alcohol dehydrogenase family) [Brevibacterium sanguinis]|uniref:NAD(P)-dependent dehydrogenase (Short-subunit alcohol dehydrogenase family) n=2 Tax=Brevibacterium TaxID=1696 RepID=A0A366IK14_9MICO|nr:MULTISPECIES: SDR family NAD(P)-dependent oxidoreductase [Brevibacterium]RBP65061.1 NAD(P)-dependent dehydrogenase (short-subunit alcohol dehydrogenase family) [Brevibacterium sanguinis]RBP71324.1 NAD(P)-dependent dehydrogenase (short-subunit alcohol dehydrogenase family) [Brevibacterium celere]
MTDLSGKTIIAIGCGTPDGQINNGFAAVRAFLAAGARVCIVDRDAAALEHARAALDAGDSLGGEAPRFTTVAADVGDEDSLTAAFAHCAEVLGTPTVLHYNVGIVVNGGLDTLDAEDFRTALDINLLGAFRAMKLALGHMREAGGGSIITVSSVGGMRHMGYDYPAYAASKAGLIALTKATALQHAAEGIRANSIAPGLIETPLIHGSISGHYASVEEMLAARHALSPTGRMGRPEDVADLAVFLASDAAAYINATVIPVDGGLVHRAGGVEHDTTTAVDDTN